MQPCGLINCGNRYKLALEKKTNRSCYWLITRVFEVIDTGKLPYLQLNKNACHTQQLGSSTQIESNKSMFRLTYQQTCICFRIEYFLGHPYQQPLTQASSMLTYQWTCACMQHILVHVTSHASTGTATHFYLYETIVSLYLVPAIYKYYILQDISQIPSSYKLYRYRGSFISVCSAHMDLILCLICDRT